MDPPSNAWSTIKDRDGSAQARFRNKVSVFSEYASLDLQRIETEHDHDDHDNGSLRKPA